MSTVINTAGHAIDLADGRTIAPGETVNDLDVQHPHNALLVVSGRLYVTEGRTPRKAPTEEALVKAAVKDNTPAESADADKTSKETI